MICGSSFLSYICLDLKTTIMRNTIIMATATVLVFGAITFLFTFNPYLLAGLFLGAIGLVIYTNVSKKKKFLVRVRTYGHGGQFTVEWSYGYDVQWNKFQEPMKDYTLDYFRPDVKEVMEFAKAFDSYEKVEQYNKRIEELFPKIDNTIVISKYDE